MNDRIPDRVIVLDSETGKLIVCALSIVQEGIPIYRMIPGKNYEQTVDAIRGASYKPTQGGATEKPNAKSPLPPEP